MGYTKWDNFLNVISKAKTACDISGRQVSDHFADVGNMVTLGSGSQREISDIMLTRYACYLTAQNGDPAKQEIAFTTTEKEFSNVIYEQTGGNQNFAVIRSEGDPALFGKNTKP